MAVPYIRAHTRPGDRDTSTSEPLARVVARLGDPDPAVRKVALQSVAAFRDHGRLHPTAMQFGGQSFTRYLGVNHNSRDTR